MAPKKPAADGGPQISFEDAMKRLETIVEELESGQLSLEDSISRYEEGVQLSRRLTTTLDEAEKRIERLVEDGDAGPATRVMQTGESDDEPSPGKLPF